jgi:sialic acid synthase SpsE
MGDLGVKIKIGEREVGDGKPTYIIAEIGSNHDSSLDKAKELIDAAAEAGADAAKFQSLNFEKVHHPERSNENVAELYKKIHLPESWHQLLADHCKKKGLHFLSSVTYLEAVDLVVSAGAPAIKIASAQFDIFPDLITKAAQTGLPLIMSSGLADYGGIERMKNLVNRENNDQLILLHCITEYPAPLERVNLNLIKTYRRAFGCIVGYSDHTLGVAVAPAAVALGAAVIEKHITIDRKGNGPDHFFAATHSEFKEMTTQIRFVESALGDGIKAPLNEAEKLQRDAFLYKWVAQKDLKAGERINLKHLALRRMDGGIPEQMGEHLFHHLLTRDVSAGTPLEWTDLAYET